MKKQLLTFLALLITGIISAQVGIGTTTPSQALDVETNEAGGTAIDINNTGTGDPKINLQLNGTTTFSIGVDNDDADKLKIGTSAPETNTRVTIDNTGNVGVGTATPDQSAVLDAFSTTKGFLPPRLTTTQRNAITNPATGLVVFNTTTGFIEVNVGTTIAPSWQVISPGATGPTGATGATGAQGPTGLLTAGTTAGNTPYWNGTSWVVNSSNIFNNGDKVGIGTSNPIGLLEIQQTLQNGYSWRVNDGTSWISVIPNLAGYNPISQSGDIGLIFSTDNSKTVAGGNGLVIAPWNDVSSGLIIMDDGKVGIGTNNPGYTFTVNGQPAANGYTAFTNYSDRRLKTNIDSFKNGTLEKILQLNPVSFQYNDKYLQLYPESDLKRVHKGFIAQEIQKVFPEMVSEMKESPDSVKYLDLDISHLQVYLVKAMQEQHSIIEAQKKEIEAQKVEIDALKVNALKVAELENKINAMLLLLNNKQELTVKQD